MKRYVSGLVVLAAAGVVIAQPAPPARPIALIYGHDLRVRPGGQKDFTKDTPRIGVEFFHDAANGCLLALSEAGDVTAIAFASLGEKAEAQWLFAHDLRVRRSDEARFTQETKTLGVEVFRDLASGKLLYVSEAKTIALADAPTEITTDRQPAFHHGLVIPVRPADKTDWTAAKKFGVEAFRDGNTGGLIYLSETGSLATAAAPATSAAVNSPQSPQPLHGLSLRVRKADEPDFSDTTRRLSVEVYADPNTGGVLYVSETGSVAAVPAPAMVKTGEKVTWKGAFNLKARRGGETDFDKAARYGVEVFEDSNTGYLVYACETGSIAVVAKK
jgi:hypothetical protein